MYLNFALTCTSNNAKNDPCCPTTSLVSCVPPVVLASSEKTNIEMFSVGNHVLGIQCHPELSKDVVVEIIHGFRAADTISFQIR
ncbi:hypothetical protein H6P81_010145 [Aristolochia fimbriata]|uniref:Glutamine amidotransferase domain-containing protein n=1 Tax=Aristolochia fimbriata TaxID=158543 RepID=A0AAV7EMY4_ARIFI|nr:hypothetical protein H6P81_010145 [Aristolochia fimbriata]